MQKLYLFVVMYITISQFGAVHGHGYLKDPPSRSSMWRFGFDTPKNFGDNELFCGGFQYQQNRGGKCGLCGDPYDKPRENEAGGKYATGIISKNYTAGSSIDITVRITANHLGYFEFRLCENNDVNKAITGECLKHLLLNPETGETKHTAGKVIGDIVTRVKLPEGVTCSQCVLQWRYHTGNSWGTDDDGTSCVGCGPQEEFYGCSDIGISSSGVDPTVLIPKTSTLSSILKTSTTRRITTEAATAETTTTETAVEETTTAVPPPTTASSTTRTTASLTTPTTVQKKTTLPNTTTTSSTTSSTKRTAVPTTTHTTTTTTTTTTIPASTNKLSCKALAAPTTDTWCNYNCNHIPSYCPSNVCQCT